jgi:ABC-type transport system involved in Fe-S cluster assembly fused permease/ATPase subunit
MNAITEVIQAGIRRVATATFSHLHDLDLNYHR